MVPARERSVPLTTEYRMTDAGKAQLGSLVGTIAANPGAMVQPSELRRMAGDPSIRETLARLPQGMTETDFIGVLKLALLTESATDATTPHGSTASSPMSGCRTNGCITPHTTRC
jgi:hypothetical protein